MQAGIFSAPAEMGVEAVVVQREGMHRRRHDGRELPELDQVQSGRDGSDKGGLHTTHPPAALVLLRQSEASAESE